MDVDRISVGIGHITLPLSHFLHVNILATSMDDNNDRYCTPNESAKTSNTPDPEHPLH